MDTLGVIIARLNVKLREIAQKKGFDDPEYEKWKKVKDILVEIQRKQTSGPRR